MPLIDLEPWEVEQAFSSLASAFDNFGVRQPFDPLAIDRQVQAILAERQARMENLLNTYDEWAKKAKRYSRKNETYPIVYL